MTLAIAADLVGSSDPQAAQLAITGATIGVSYTVTGSAGGGVTWPVRGGNPNVALNTQIVLVDVSAPVNVPVTYMVTDGTNSASTTLTVPFAGRALLASVDGQVTVSFLRLRNNGAPRALQMRQKFYQVRGRRYPVMRYDVPGGETGQIVVETIDEQTDAMWDLLNLGGLALFRTDGAVRDLPAVQYIAATSPDSALDVQGTDDTRTWTLDYQVVGDPEPDTVVVAVDWDDFDDAYLTFTWTNFDTEWSASTWDLLEREDWSAR